MHGPVRADVWTIFLILFNFLISHFLSSSTQKNMFDENETPPSSSATYGCPQLQENEWLEIQDSLKKKLIIQDDFHWRLPLLINKEEKETAEKCDDILKYVGGVDLSFSKDDPSLACGTLVVMDIENLNVVFQDSSVVKLNVPYIPGFLAFREAPVHLEILEKMKKSANPLYPQLFTLVIHVCPQLLMVDGNGILHPRGFGLASHLGVLADLPTIGVGKNMHPLAYAFILLHHGVILKYCIDICQLHHIDGLTFAKVRDLLEENSSRDILTLTGDSGCTLGAAMRSTEGSLKPIFVSVGHRISLATAVKIVKMTCRFRIPEPIRQADIRSKECLQKLNL